MHYSINSFVAETKLETARITDMSDILTLIQKKKKNLSS